MKCICGTTLTQKCSLLRLKRESCPMRVLNNTKVTGHSPPPKRMKVGSSTALVKTTLSDLCQGTNLVSGNQMPNKICENSCIQHLDEGNLISCDQPNSSKYREINFQQQNNSVTNVSVEEISSAFKCRINSYRLSPIMHHINHEDFFKDVENDVLALFSKYRDDFDSLKVNCILFSTYVIPHKDLVDLKSFNTKNRIILQSTYLNELYDQFKNEIMKKVDKIQERNSGWSLQQIMYLEVNINKYNPLRAGGYMSLPKQIADKKAIINIQNNDNKCFAYAIMAAIFPASNHSERITSYPNYSTFLNFEDMEFPIKITDIPKFESLNEISINVFGLKAFFIDGKTKYDIVGPLYFTKSVRNVHVNLLYLSDDNGNNHYCLIKNLSRLVSSQKSKYKHQSYICNGCLQFFNSPKHLLAHEQNDCIYICSKLPTNQPFKNKLGEMLPENILKFVNIEKQLALPFIVYADFESILRPIHHNQPKDDNSFTVKTYEHVPFSFCFYIKCNFDDSFSELVHYKGLDAPEKFVELLEQHAVRIYYDHLKHVKPMLPLTKEQMREFEESKVCHICDKEFKNDDIKVRDHNHENGVYRGPAHAQCNLHYKTPKFIPVVFHNLTNYDCHLFIKQLGLKKEKIDVLGVNKEKYITFVKHICVEKGIDWKDSVYLKLRFIDSFRFLPSSIEKLSQTLEEGQCCEIKKYFKEQEQFEQIRRKGVFPYSYIDCMEKLSETTFPTHDNFYDILRDETISLDEYQRGQYIWNLFNCQTLGDYSDIYVISDVLLLADIFENFRKVCLEAYKLDPAQYITAPSLSWDAMLRHTNVELELLTDIDMLHFFRKGIRGGITQCSKRAAEANNKFLPNYNDSKPTSYLMYLDATNLYGFAMSQCLPQGEFRWLSNEEIHNLEIKNIEDDSDNGYVLEVDLEYPAKLHDFHNDLPFCAENLVPPNGKNSKLLLTLSNKSLYIIHYRNLKQCLKHGLKLKKIHRAIEFKQSPWLKPYIDLNTKFRNSAKNAFEKDLFKYLINSIFGKTMENVEKRQDIKLKTHWESIPGSVGAEALISRPNFKSVSVFSENLVAVQMAPLVVKYDKPLYVGFSILDISKTKMYSFFYDYIKPNYGQNATLCYTDTDSQILEICSDNVYDDIKKNIDWFDTSNYQVDNIYSMPKTMSIVGKMKDEYAGQVVHKFYGTGAKAYCVKLQDSETKKAKGIVKSVIKKQLCVDDYKYVVENGGSIYKKMYIFKSTLHTMYTELKNKVALCSFDDKRYLIDGDVKTLAWGHYSLNSTPEENLDMLLSFAYEFLDEKYSNDCNFYVNNFDDNLLVNL